MSQIYFTAGRTDSKLDPTAALPMNPVHRGWKIVSRRLAVHVVAFALVLVALNAVIPVDASLGTDDGAYGGQVHALRNGSWTIDRPLPVVAADNEGWSNAAITDTGPLPYTTNPLYVVLLAFTASVGDGIAERFGGGADIGRYASALAMQTVPALGALLAAVAAWMLAAHWRPSSSPLAFWLVAAGPLLVTSTGLWAHPVAAAASGFAVLGVVKYLDGGSHADRVGLDGRWLAIAVVALACIAVLRTESALWIAALCATTIVTARSRRGWTVAAVGGGVSALVWALNRGWGLSIRAERLPIVTDGRADGGTGGWLVSRLPAGWELLATTVRPGPGPVAVLAATVLVAVAAVMLRSSDDHNPDVADRSPWPRVVVSGLLVLAAVVYASVVILAPGQLLAGLVPSWLVVVPLLVAGWARFGSLAVSGEETVVAPVSLLLGSGAAFTFLVVLTQYGNSGGLQWGGRYLTLAYVPVAAAAAVVGVGLVARYRLPMTILLVAPTVVGLAASHQLHTTHHEVLSSIEARPAEVVVTDVRPLPRLAWTALPTAYYLAEADDVARLFGELDDAGVETVAVYGIGSADVDGLAGYRLEGEAGNIRWLAKP